jgi:hypothetical protein
MTNAENLVSINYAKLCPHLIQKGASHKPLELNIRSYFLNNETCDTGGSPLSTEVVTDLMLNEEELIIKVACPGCDFQNRFSDVVKVDNPLYRQETKPDPEQ